VQTDTALRRHQTLKEEIIEGEAIRRCAESVEHEISPKQITKPRSVEI
jgi:hypothetical protein